MIIIRMHMSEKNTKQRLLDAAEHLFAAKGYPNTSLRDITSTAKANLAGVNYHFGSKDKLLIAVMERRIGPVNQKRLRMLEEIRQAAMANGRPPGTKSVLRAFIEPTFDIFESGQSGKDFVGIISQAHIDPDDTIRKRFMALVHPMVEQFLSVLYEAIPDLPKETVFTRFMMALGAMGHTLLYLGKTQTLSILGDEMPFTPDIRTIAEELITFAANGMEG